MSPTLRKVIVLLVIVLILAADCDAKRKRSKKYSASRKSPMAKELELRETNPPNFLRLLIMRMIYGIAAQMNIEDRVAGWFNGAFVPPNADDYDFGLGGGLDDLGAEDLFDA